MSPEDHNTGHPQRMFSVPSICSFQLGRTRSFGVAPGASFVFEKLIFISSFSLAKNKTTTIVITLGTNSENPGEDYKQQLIKLLPWMDTFKGTFRKST